MARPADFPPSVKERLLVASHRRCCVCHRYCGVKAEVDHIEPAADGGSGDADNAIVLCFDCHAEVHHYNTKHPKGTKFRPSELRHHRDQWVRLCEERPEMFVQAMPSPEAGSLERLLSELQFNAAIARYGQVTGPMEVTQFRRAIADGTFSWVDSIIGDSLRSAYVEINRFNAAMEKYLSGAERTDTKAASLLVGTQGPIGSAISALIGSEV